MDIDNLLKSFPDQTIEGFESQGAFTLWELPQSAHMKMQRLDPDARDYQSRLNLIVTKYALKLDESLEELADKFPPTFSTAIGIRLMQLLGTVDEDGNVIEEDPVKNSESTQSAVSNLG